MRAIRPAVPSSAGGSFCKFSIVAVKSGSRSRNCLDGPVAWTSLVSYHAVSPYSRLGGPPAAGSHVRVADPLLGDAKHLEPAQPVAPLPGSSLPDPVERTRVRRTIIPRQHADHATSSMLAPVRDCPWLDDSQRGLPVALSCPTLHRERVCDALPATSLGNHRAYLWPLRCAGLPSLPRTHRCRDSVPRLCRSPS